MAIVTMRQLLESGVHFGHQTRRWNPKMKRFILTERNGIYIIDLQQTIADIDEDWVAIHRVTSPSRFDAVLSTGACAFGAPCTGQRRRLDRTGVPGTSWTYE